MSVRVRNNVHLAGDGAVTMVFVHGFGCNQTMWRLLAPAFQDRYRTLTYDLVGSGESDLRAYDRDKYASLHGHADDLAEIIATCPGPVVLVGHSVGATIALLAANRLPERVLAQVMIGPSPGYINDGDYRGGFDRDEMLALLDAMEADFLGWSMKVAPLIMGAPSQPELSAELVRSFCRNDPAIARHYARVTFLSDHRADLADCAVPTLVLQCSDDPIVPREMGGYLLRHLRDSELRVIANIGHCAHLSAPGPSGQVIEAYLARLRAR
jgi:sigma-B regulation protein RsbQ